MDHPGSHWTVIRPEGRWLDLRLDEVWRYRYLIFMFIRRDFVAGYKQTILGPLWYVIPPLISAAAFTIVFGNIAS
ncbi:MAG: ABC transporter permease, partial [Myxococcota bacterium]